MEIAIALSISAILVSILGILVTLAPSPSQVVVFAHDPSYVGNKRRYLVSGTSDAPSAIEAVRSLSKKRIVGYSLQVAPITFPTFALEPVAVPVLVNYETVVFRNAVYYR